MPEAHPDNVPGPFYVANGCCTSCAVPYEIAPDLFEFAPDGHCFFRRQPGGADEVDKAVAGMWSAEFRCIRYRGTDPALLRRIAQLGLAENCDAGPGAVAPLVRDRVLFTAAGPSSPEALAARFRTWLEAPREWERYRLCPGRPWSPSTVRFSWDWRSSEPPVYHAVRFRAAPAGLCEASMAAFIPHAGRGLAMTVHEWLTEAEHATRISWTSAEERRAGVAGFHMPL